MVVELTTAEWVAEWESEGIEEFRRDDRTITLVGYRQFVSRSKGIRNGKRRVRRKWKEVELYRYRGGKWHQEHRFPFDEIVTECLGRFNRAEEDEFREYIKQNCDRNGGS